MPVVYLMEKERLGNSVVKWVGGEMKARRLTQAALAKKMGITHQALSKKFSRRSFSFADFVFFAREFQPDNDELRDIIGL